MSKEVDRRIVLYPHYITAGKTVAEGRRIPKNLACDRPNSIEMADCCKLLKIPVQVEDKHYPRDWFIRGRLRVQLKNEDGTLINSEIPDRRTLLIKISELVPKHPSRAKKTAGAGGTGNLMDAYSAEKAAAILADAGSSKGAASTSTAKAPAKGGGSAKSNKKKGKK